MKRREVVTIVVAVLVVGLLFVALKLSGGGNPKSASEKPMAPSESAESSADTPKSLSDAAVEQLLKDADDYDSLEKRNKLHYQINESKPYSGWAKAMYDSGQVKFLVHYKEGKTDGLQTYWQKNGQKETEGTYKDGKFHGLWTNWYENGQKLAEVTFKDGKQDGPYTTWHENGQKEAEGTYKDGEEVSANTGTAKAKRLRHTRRQRTNLTLPPVATSAVHADCA
jgi:hypothetical protein